MKIIVYHAEYGCDTGCCGHVIETDEGGHEFVFSHPYGEDIQKWAADLIEEKYPGHSKDLDWENSHIADW